MKPPESPLETAGDNGSETHTLLDEVPPPLRWSLRLPLCAQGSDHHLLDGGA